MRLTSRAALLRPILWSWNHAGSWHSPDCVSTVGRSGLPLPECDVIMGCAGRRPGEPADAAGCHVPDGEGRRGSSWRPGSRHPAPGDRTLGLEHRVSPRGLGRRGGHWVSAVHRPRRRLQVSYNRALIDLTVSVQIYIALELAVYKHGAFILIIYLVIFSTCT